MLEDGRTLRVVGYIAPDHRPVIVSDDGTPIEDAARTGREARAAALHQPRGRSRRRLDDYQTVVCRACGCDRRADCGTAFHRRGVRRLAAAGVAARDLTLHIGPGTFAPVRAPMVESHSMEAEWYTIPPATRDAIDACQAHRRPRHRGRHQQRARARIVCGDGRTEGFTGLFIFPGFRFKLVDAMITNFHMPRTTVLALVMALAGRDDDSAAYREAIRHRYRFLSYGDAMLIL